MGASVTEETGVSTKKSVAALQARLVTVKVMRNRIKRKGGFGCI
jgi:hypothetical protein